MSSNSSTIAVCSLRCAEADAAMMRPSFEGPHVRHELADTKSGQRYFVLETSWYEPLKPT